MKLRSHKMRSNNLNEDSRPYQAETEGDLLAIADEDGDKVTRLADEGIGSGVGIMTSGPVNARPRRFLKKIRHMDVVTVLHINMFLYSTCFWIQTGVLPYLTRSLSLDTVAFGYLQTTFYVVQLIGGPLYGRFGDIYGGRIALIAAFVSAALMYGILGAATSAFGVFLSRLPSLFVHAFQGTQMVIVDETEPSKRAAALGRISLSYGLGMVIGPLIGGQLASKVSEQSSAYVACGGSLLSVLIVFKFIPASTSSSSVGIEDKEETKTSGSIFSLSKIISLLTDSPGAIFFLFLMLISCVPNSLFQSMLSVITMETFELTSDQTGYILSFTGVISMLAQGIGIGILTNMFSDTVIVNGSIITLLVSYALLCFVSSASHLVLVLVLLTCGQSIIGTVLTSSLTKTVSVTDTGTMLGLGMACSSLVSTVSPTVGAYLLEQFGITSFGLVGVVVYSLLLLTPKN